MTATDPNLPQDLIDRAMGLPAASRERLGYLLLGSLLAIESTGGAVRDLLRKRTDELATGKVELLDADELAASLERRFGSENL